MAGPRPGWDQNSVLCVLVCSGEELLEMFGVTLLLFALSDHVTRSVRQRPTTDGATLGPVSE